MWFEYSCRGNQGNERKHKFCILWPEKMQKQIFARNTKACRGIFFFFLKLICDIYLHKDHHIRARVRINKMLHSWILGERNTQRYWNTERPTDRPPQCKSESGKRTPLQPGALQKPLRLPFHIVINHFFVPSPHFKWLIPALKLNSCRLCILKVRELAKLQPLRSPIPYGFRRLPHTHTYTWSTTNTHTCTHKSPGLHKPMA